METEKINQLISKYEEGKTTSEEERALYDFFRGDDVPEELQEYADLFEHYDEIRVMESSREFNPFAKISFEKEGKSPLTKGKEIDEDDFRGLSKAHSSSAFRWTLRIAAGFALLLLGFAAGQFLDTEDYASTGQVAQLEQEVKQMKEALMNTGNYQVASAGERLSAVNISAEIPATDRQLDQQIADILIYTLNNDESVNVRLAAAEALFRFQNEPSIKRALIASLNNQNDPFMQITLIDMLVELKAADAINNMQKLLVDTDTQEIVRDRLKTGIAQLKA